MIRASVMSEPIGDIEYRLVAFDRKKQYLQIRAEHFKDRFAAADHQTKNYVGRMKSSIYPVTTITLEYDDDIEIVDYTEEVDTVCDDFIVSRSYYRGFRIDINNRSDICVFRKNSDGDFEEWKMMEGRIRNNPRNYYVDDVLEFIDEYLFEKHKDWSTLYVVYHSSGYHGDDRGYFNAYTSLDKAREAVGGYTLEEIEVPFIDNELFYVKWNEGMKGTYIRVLERYEETSDLYSSLDLAKDDDIWKGMLKLVSDNPNKKFHVANTIIATDVDGMPFDERHKYGFHGSCAEIRSIPIVKD